METVTLDMQMSSDEALETVVIALRDMPGVGACRIDRSVPRHLLVTVDLADPDTVDIVREIIWELDGLATQLAMHLDVA